MSRKSVGFQTTKSTTVAEKQKSQFDSWADIKRCSVDNAYKKLLHFRSAIYTSTSGRQTSITPTTVRRRRKRTDSALTADSDGRSSALSIATDCDPDAFFKEQYDFDAEEPQEPPLHPHLVHTPGTHAQELYLKACRKLAIPNSSLFYKSLVGDVIVLRRQGLGPLGVKACAIALAETLTVHTLDLSENSLGSEGARYLSELILENHFIKHLILSDNNLGQEGTSFLATVLRKTDSLQSLHISGNGLRGTRVKPVCSIIDDTLRLTSLDLSNNDTGDIGAALLGDALAFTDSVKELDLSWNQIRGTGAIKIAEAITTNQGLTKLNLAWNGLHLKGCTALAKALERNSALTDLDLSSNRIDKGCLEKLLEGLRKNSTLCRLTLGRNPLKPDDAMILLGFFKKYPTSGLKEIHLDYVDVTPTFVEDLKALKAERKATFNIKYEKVCGQGQGISDVDEADLLSVEPDILFSELEAVTGVNVESFVLDIETDIGYSLTPIQLIIALKLINNPLSDRCSEILVNRLSKNNKTDIRQLSERRSQRQRLHGQERKFKLTAEEQESGELLDIEIEHRNTVQAVKNAVLRVMARRIAGSSLYKTHLHATRGDLARPDIDGRRAILRQVVAIIKDY